MSSEEYTAAYFKNRSKEEIENDIKRLKSEIRRLIQKHDNPDEEMGLMFEDYRDVIRRNLENYGNAVKAYQQKGGKYIPTKEEQKVLDFDDAISHLKTLKFEIWGQWIIRETVTCTVERRSVSVITEAYPRYESPYTKEKFTIPKERFFSVLRNLHMGMWLRRYYNENISDGGKWLLRLTFTDRRPREYSGSNHYPWNFEELRSLLKKNSRKQADSV